MTTASTITSRGALTSNPATHGGPAADRAPATLQANAPAPAGGPTHPEAHRRFRICLAIDELVADGSSIAEACKVVEISQATASRWLRKLADLDADWRHPEHRPAVLAALTPGKSPGRPCRWEVLLDVEAVQLRLRTLYLSTIGASSDYMSGGRRSAKLATALIRFAEEPECPYDLAKKLRRGYQPAAFTRFLRSITPEQEARLRGPKHAQLHGLRSRRDKTIRLADGSVAEMPAGFMWEFDDMSANQPFYVDGPSGPLMSRQGLYCVDVRSGRWLGVDLVARPREAYRAEDILRFLRRLIQDYGKPDMIRLEQGVWRSRAIAGFRVTTTGTVDETEDTRPPMDDDQRHLLQDGLRAIGIEIQYAYSAHHKTIEGRFNHLQTILATYTTDLQNIGRHAGEFEHGAKQLRRVRAASHHPRDLGFAHIDTLATRIERAFAFENRRANTRTGQSPDQIWERDLTARPLPHLQRGDLAAFLPTVREATVRGGLLTVTIDGRPHDFRADHLVELGTGYRVYLRLDLTEPTLGAAIYSRETSSAKQAAPGRFLCWADYEIPGAQVTLSADAATPRGLEPRTVAEYYQTDVDRGRDARRAQARMVRTAYRSLPRPGQPAVRAATARDGRGAVTTTSSARANAEDIPPSSRLLVFGNDLPASSRDETSRSVPRATSPDHERIGSPLSGRRTDRAPMTEDEFITLADATCRPVADCLDEDDVVERVTIPTAPQPDEIEYL